MKKTKLFQTKKKICRTSTTYFANIVSDLQIPKIQEDASDIRSNNDLVLAAINTFQNHPSVINIKQREFKSQFKKLNIPTTCQGSDIPTKVIKINIFVSTSTIA